MPSGTMESEYFQDIPKEKKVINTAELFNLAIDELQDEKELGIDAEWKINYGEAKDKIALFQISSWHCCYVFQIIKLKEVLRRRDWLRFGIKLLGNEKIKKIGYHLVNDLLMLLKSIPDVKACIHPEPNIMDLKLLQNEMKRRKPDVFSSRMPEEWNDQRGLSGLVTACLGRPLKKELQKSDWEADPLTEELIIYACTDPYVMLPVYQKMKKIWQENWAKDVDEDKFQVHADRILGINTPKKKRKWRVVWNGRSVTPAVPRGFCFRFNTPGIRCRWDVQCWWHHRCWDCYRRHPIYTECLPPGQSPQKSPRSPQPHFAANHRGSHKPHQPMYHQLQYGPPRHWYPPWHYGY